MSPPPQPYRRSQNRLRLFVLILVLCPFSLWAQKKTAPHPPARKPAVLEIDEVYAAILWHRFNGSEMPQNEMLKIFSVDLERYDEFTRRKVLKSTEEKLRLKQGLCLKTTTYTVAVGGKIGEYDFEQKLFPSGLSAGEVRIGVGEVSYVPSDTGDYTAKFYVSLLVPEEMEIIPLSEKEAEKLSERLQFSRDLEVKFWFILEETLPEVRDGNLHNRGFQCKVYKVEIALPQSTILLGTNTYPRKVLNVWKAP